MEQPPRNVTLVTGATGFIGQALLSRLIKQDRKVRLLTRTPVDHLDCIVCDFKKDEIPEKAISGVDSIFHLASYAHDIFRTQKESGSYHRVNVSSTELLVKLAIKHEVKRFIYVSSVKAGGIPPAHYCADEKDSFPVSGIYAETKRLAEEAITKHTANSSIKTTIVRPALVYGTEMKGNLGLMMKGIRQGWFPPLPQIDNRRSLIGLHDLIEALLFIERTPATSGETYIATDGNAYTTTDIYEAMLKYAGKQTPVWRVPLSLLENGAKLSKYVSHFAEKLLSDECYNSEKLRSIGFMPRQSLWDFHEKAD